MKGGQIRMQRSMDRHPERGSCLLCSVGRLGPFRTDNWQYVFGPERPLPNLNKGAGLDVSPAVRDFLGLDETDVTDWKFVDFKKFPGGRGLPTATTMPSSSIAAAVGLPPRQLPGTPSVNASSHKSFRKNALRGHGFG